MPSNEKRKYQQVIDYVEDQIGADVNRDLLEVAIGAQDVVPMEVETGLKEALKSSDNDEIVARLTGSDGDEIVEEALGTDVDTVDVALLTYLSRALNTVGSDELVARTTDSAGNQIDPLEQDVYESVGNDELRSMLVAYDTTGTARSSGLALLGNDLPSPNFPGLATYLSRALHTVGQDEIVSRLSDTTGTQIDPARKATHDTVYTSIDLNTAATTTVYGPTTEAEVDGIHLNHGGATAELRLEVTDGTNTAVLEDAAAGDPIHYPDPLHVNSDDSLQVVVEVVEGSALTETAAVSRGEL